MQTGYRLFKDDDSWYMEQIENNKVVFAVMGNSEIDCFNQMFAKEITKHETKTLNRMKHLYPFMTMGDLQTVATFNVLLRQSYKEI